MRSTLLFALAPLALAASVAAAAEPSVLPTKPGDKISRNTPIDGKTLPDWIKQIKDPDPALAELAMQAVQLYGPDVAAREAGPALLDTLSNREDGALRVHACLALASLGVDSSLREKAIPILSRRLNDQQSIVRFHTVLVTVRMGADARPLVGELINRVKDQGSFEIRRMAAIALGRAGQATVHDEIDMGAARALLGTFSGPYPDYCADVRLAAVKAFGSMGIPRDQTNRNAIVQALSFAAQHDKHKAVVIWAHVGLMANEQPPAVHLPAIVAFLKDPDFNAHFEALAALGTIDKKTAKPSVPEVMKGLDDKDLVIQAASAWALGQMGDSAEAAVPALQAVVDKKDTNPGVKEACKAALEQITGKKVADDKPKEDKAADKK